MAKSILKLGGKNGKKKKGIPPLLLIGAAAVGLIAFMRGGDEEDESEVDATGWLAEEMAQRFDQERVIISGMIEDINERLLEISDREDTFDSLPYEPVPSSTPKKKSTAKGNQASTGLTTIPVLTDISQSNVESAVAPAWNQTTEVIHVGPLPIPLSIFPADAQMAIAAGAPVSIQTDMPKTTKKTTTKKTTTVVKATAESAKRAEEAVKAGAAAGKTTVTIGPLVLPTSLANLAAPVRSSGRTDQRATTTDAKKTTQSGQTVPKYLQYTAPSIYGKTTVDIYAKAGTVGH